MAKGVRLLPSDPKNRDIVRDLIQLIQNEGLNPGDRLPPIRQLAEMLQASGSVVRDSLMKVQTMGLIKILPRSGAFVQSLDYSPLVSALADTLEGEVMRVDHNLFHLLKARQLLEIDAVGEAARRRRLEDLLPIREALTEMDHIELSKSRTALFDVDIRFHLGIATIAGNPVLVTMLRALLGLLQPYLIKLTWSNERQDFTRHSHVAIYEALVAGDIERARESMDEHLQLAYDSLLDQVRSAPNLKTTDPDTEDGMKNSSSSPLASTMEA